MQIAFKSLRLKWLSILSVLLACANAYAATNCSSANSSSNNSTDAYEDYVPMQGAKYRWTLGFDVDYQYMKPQNDFRYLTYSHRQGMEIYTAYRFLNPLSLELGYYWTNDKIHNVPATVGYTLFGVTSQVDATYSQKIRVAETYFDLYWHTPMTILKQKTEIKFGLGVGWLRENFRSYNTVDVGATDPLAVTLYYLSGTTSMVARFNLGLQTLFGKRWGGRVLASFQTTSNSHASCVPPPASNKLFGNSYLIGVGLFYNLTGYYWLDD
jgi:uncharacterized protein (DUF2164 family)